MADLSDKARWLLIDTINTDPQDWKKNEDELRRYMSALESVYARAKDFADKLTVAPGDKHSDVQRYNALVDSIRRLDGAGEGDK